MRLTKYFYAVLWTLHLLIPATTVNAEILDEYDPADMPFAELNAQEQVTVSENLQELLDESIHEAEKEIREHGGIVPFAYAGNTEGEGQFLWFDHDEPVAPEIAAKTLERAIIQGSVDGNLVASLMYMTAGTPSDLNQQTRSEIESDLPGGLTLDDLRFLIVEMQHLAGIGLINVIPYWQENGEWRFGEPQHRSVDPALHNTVRHILHQMQQQEG